jgi:hypothetical protein
MYFYIQRTKTTPSAIINDGYMKISGNAMPVEDQSFFGVINKQLNRYIKEPANKTSVDISLTHVNAGSKKQIINLFNQLEVLGSLGFIVEVNWYYEVDNDDVKELGEIIENMFNIQVNLIEKNGR